MNNVYGEQIRKDIEKNLLVKPEYQTMFECDERVKDYWRISQADCIDKMVHDTGLENEDENLKTMPLHLGAFELSNSKPNMNNFILDNIAFYTNDVYNGDTDSLYIENKPWHTLDKAGLVGLILLQGKSDYQDGGNFYGLFLAQKI